MNLTNQFLIAQPGMPDERFTEAVILICEHNEHGAMGIRVNQLSDIDFEEVLEGLDIEAADGVNNQPIFSGGPVNAECGFILHRGKQNYDSSLQLTPSLALTTSKDIILAIAKNNLKGEWFMTLGCATWEAGQLEQEIADNDWLSGPVDENLVFDLSEDKWSQALALLGIKPHQLVDIDGHA
ncbi:YqgE/AlgH family protein [Marinicella gelatinilytica]|uniref:YqgE/AlgH family protein n=1 Tax=Marinicella gelatinilytica TaxID=2996017 RepID=UPI002260F9F9|nr:YqgE/AlgH family protein [Marinicella gelatinilytica]MCX7544254.1 YqgE/AlgH family protein [Marinicella gelatinilytica]